MGGVSLAPIFVPSYNLCICTNSNAGRTLPERELQTVMEVAQLSSDVASLLADARSGKGLTLNQLQALQQIHQLKAWQQRETEERREKAANLQLDVEPFPPQRNLLVTGISRQKENTTRAEWSPLKEISNSSRGYILPQPLEEVHSVAQLGTDGIKGTEQALFPYSHSQNTAAPHLITIHNAHHSDDFSNAGAPGGELNSVYSDSCESVISACSVNEPLHAAPAGEVSLEAVGRLDGPLLKGDDRPIHPGVGAMCGCGTFEEMVEKQLQKHQAEVCVHIKMFCPP